MSSVQLLDRTRKIGKLLHNKNSSKVAFNDICKVMREILGSNVLVISRKGKVLGIATADNKEVIAELLKDEVGSFIDPMLNERLLSVLSTKENVNLATLGFENQSIMKSAIGTLSYSETQAIIHIFQELNGLEGVLVASKIADRAGITRSVIVNALRKFESAGIIESRSSGMKGTYIKVRNNVVFEEVKKLEESMKL